MARMRFLIRMAPEVFKLVLVGKTKAESFVKCLFALAAMLVPAIAVTRPIEIIVDANGWNQRFETRIGFIITGLVLLVVVPTALAIAWNRVPRVVFCDEPFQEDTGDRNWHSRIRVRNDSGKSLECSVSLETADPPLPHCPIPLHCSHVMRPNSNVVTLAPDQNRTFDVCRITEETRKLEITGSVFEGEIPLKKYTVTIAIFAKDCPPERKQFVIEPRGNVVDFRAV